MNQKEIEKKITLIYETAKELSGADIPIVRQRAEMVEGLLRELMVTVVNKG